MQTGMGFLKLLQASIFLKWKMQKYITNHLIADEDEKGCEQNLFTVCGAHSTQCIALQAVRQSGWQASGRVDRKAVAGRGGSTMKGTKACVQR